MLAVSHPRSTALPPIPRGAMDESGTINPAALNTSASNISPNLLAQPSARGTKRSRSPDSRGLQSQEGEGGNVNTYKRSRQQPGDKSSASSVPSHLPPYVNSMQALQTPQGKAQTLPQASPSQASPQRSTPGSTAKPAVVKALPTVRDHTTDQLGPEGDEYLPRETDPDGETKVSKDGYALDGRKYKCRTFHVPNRGEKLFMLATECARVLGYRDSYLLFNKNRSLYKIIANQAEKDNLIQQDILPYSYRSRQIAIVTARSMFRQFGSRLIDGGRRVRDDYWEAKARKQGFTEEDAAGEKRPGAGRAREAAAAEASQSTTTLTSLPVGEVIYANGPGVDGQAPNMQPPSSLAPLPMIHIAGDERSAFGNILRPRQELNGPPYQDRIQPGNPTEILGQAASAAEFNKQLAQTRTHRANYLDEYWRRPHEQPTTEPPHSTPDLSTIPPPNVQSPQAMTSMNSSRTAQDQSLTHSGTPMLPQTYSNFPNQHNPAASPLQSMHRSMQSTQLHQAQPSLNMSASHRQTPSYGYSSNQMWSAPQPHHSPMAQPQHVQYSQPQQAQQQSQQQQQQPPPLPQPQQQNHMPPPQMHQQPGMGYGQLNQMSNPGFPSMSRNLYQPTQGSQQFNMGPQSNANQPPGMQGWSNPGGNVQQEWPRY